MNNTNQRQFYWKKSGSERPFAQSVMETSKTITTGSRLSSLGITKFGQNAQQLSLSGSPPKFSSPKNMKLRNSTKLSPIQIRDKMTVNQFKTFDKTLNRDQSGPLSTIFQTIEGIHQRQKSTLVSPKSSFDRYCKRDKQRSELTHLEDLGATL